MKAEVPSSPRFHVIPIRALQDNYVYLVHREGSTLALVIDPSEAEPVIRELTARGLTLGLILNTHHHHDHVGGNLVLQSLYSQSAKDIKQSQDREPNFRSKFDVEVWCSNTDLDRVPGASRSLADGETFVFDQLTFETLEIPGHTQGQVAFLLKDSNGVPDVFVGDTLFAIGCGRLFEGTPVQMWQSLNKLMQLHPQSRLRFGHEYSKRNAQFALTIDASNREVQFRLASANQALAKDPQRAILPAPLLEEEMRVNPFLRAASNEIRRTLRMETAPDVDVFARLREMRNSF